MRNTAKSHRFSKRISPKPTCRHLSTIPINDVCEIWPVVPIEDDDVEFHSYGSSVYSILQCLSLSLFVPPELPTNHLPPHFIPSFLLFSFLNSSSLHRFVTTVKAVVNVGTGSVYTVVLTFFFFFSTTAHKFLISFTLLCVTCLRKRKDKTYLCP